MITTTVDADPTHTTETVINPTQATEATHGTTEMTATHTTQLTTIPDPRKDRETTKHGKTGSITNPPTTIPTHQMIKPTMNLAQPQIHHNMHQLSAKQSGEFQMHHIQKHQLTNFQKQHLQLSLFQPIRTGLETNCSTVQLSSKDPTYHATSSSSLASAGNQTPANSSTMKTCCCPRTRSTEKNGSTCWTDEKLNQQFKKQPTHHHDPTHQMHST